MTYGRRILTAVCVLCLLLCSGCGWTELGRSEELLRPPRLTGKQKGLQQALDAYLTSDYVLTYPRTGDYRTAFLFEDMDGDGEEEGVCFYRIGDGNTHVLLLRREDDVWKPVSDMEGSSIDIDWVSCGDMEGNGNHQLLIGWGIYNNSRDRQVVLYSAKNGELTALYEDHCATAFLGDVMGEGADALLLYHINSNENNVFAEMMVLRDERMMQEAEARLDGYIRSFGAPRLVSLDGGTAYGVFTDGYKDANSVITELLYWDGTQLCAPFYDADTNTNTVTVREARSQSTLTGADINGDGRWEWPQNRRLVDYQTVNMSKAWWLTSWMYYDMNTLSVEKALDTVVNETDRYIVLLEPEWVGDTADTDRVTVSYDTKTRTLTFYEVANGVKSGAIMQITPSSREAVDMENGQKMTVTLSDNATYTVWYDPQNGLGLTPERINYMIAILP